MYRMIFDIECIECRSLYSEDSLRCQAPKPQPAGLLPGPEQGPKLDLSLASSARLNRFQEISGDAMRIHEGYQVVIRWFQYIKITIE